MRVRQNHVPLLHTHIQASAQHGCGSAVAATTSQLPPPSLFCLAASGDLYAIQEMLTATENAETMINELDHRGQTALCHAVNGNHLHIAQLLLASGADVNKRDTHAMNHTPLHVAANTNNATMTKLLLQHGGDVFLRDRQGRSPFFYATKSCDVMELLLSNAASLLSADTAPAAAHFSSFSPNNIVDKSGVDLVQFSAGHAPKDVLTLMSAVGADMNTQNAQHGFTALHAAVAATNVDAIDFIMKEGFSIRQTGGHACGGRAMPQPHRTNSAGSVRRASTAVDVTPLGIAASHARAKRPGGDVMVQRLVTGDVYGVCCELPL